MNEYAPFDDALLDLLARRRDVRRFRAGSLPAGTLEQLFASLNQPTSPPDQDR